MQFPFFAISTLEGGPGLLLLYSAMLQSNSVCAISPYSSMWSGTAGGRKQLLHKGKPRKMGGKRNKRETTTLHAAVASGHGNT